jgi:hypothetical protein
MLAHTKTRIQKWFDERQLSVSVAQYMLAVDFVITYDYPIDIACKLALDSFKRHN